VYFQTDTTCSLDVVVRDLQVFRGKCKTINAINDSLLDCRKWASDHITRILKSSDMELREDAAFLTRLVMLWVEDLQTYQT
jgi:hypothetical protein